MALEAPVPMGIESLVMLLVWILVLAVVVWLVFYVLNQIALPQPVRAVIVVIVAVVLLLFLLGRLGML
jgi:hypothetical protein